MFKSCYIAFLYKELKSMLYKLTDIYRDAFYLNFSKNVKKCSIFDTDKRIIFIDYKQ